jgi:hypothetical protein
MENFNDNQKFVVNYIEDAFTNNTWRGYHSFLPNEFHDMVIVKKQYTAYRDSPMWCECADSNGQHGHRHTVWKSTMKPGTLRKSWFRMKSTEDGAAQVTKSLQLTNENHFMMAVLYVCGEEAQGSDHVHGTRNIPLSKNEKIAIISYIHKKFPIAKAQYDTYVKKRNDTRRKGLFFSNLLGAGVSRQQAIIAWRRQEDINNALRVDQCILE